MAVRIQRQACAAEPAGMPVRVASCFTEHFWENQKISRVNFWGPTVFPNLCINDPSFPRHESLLEPQKTPVEDDDPSAFRTAPRLGAQAKKHELERFPPAGNVMRHLQPTGHTTGNIAMEQNINKLTE